MNFKSRSLVSCGAESDLVCVMFLHVLGFEPQALEVDRAAGAIAGPSLSLGMVLSPVAVQKIDFFKGLRAFSASESVEVGRRHVR